MNGSEQVLEEWNAYAKKKVLLGRDVDWKQLEKKAHLKIMAITGIRRAGKSSVLIILLQKLLSQNEKAAYVNLEDSRIKKNPHLFDEIIKWFGDEGYLLLDEITSGEDWEGWLARNHELLKGKLKLIVSSSRRGLITPSKPLRGRILPLELYPLSFLEFLQFKEINLEKTTAGIGKIEKALEEYLVYGGFPEVVISSGKIDKIELLTSYFRDIIGLDIAEVSGEKVSTVEAFGKYVISASYFSASKALNSFKSLGYKIAKQSLLDLERLSQESYLFFFVPIFSYSVKDRSQYPRKAYLGDTGFMYALEGKTDYGRLFENLVYLKLRRSHLPTIEINYWKNRDGKEVDFVLREGFKAKEIIQVVYDLKEEKTIDREVSGLIACAKEFSLNQGLIITRDVEKKEKKEGVHITFIPLWKWLLTTK